MISLPTQTNQRTLREERDVLPAGAGHCLTPRLAPRPDNRASIAPSTLAQECKRQILVLVCLLVFSLLSYHLVSRYVVSAVVVQGRSMLPTLADGGRYILNRLSYYYRQPHRHELVVIQDPGHSDCAVKRIIGLPGETVQVKDGAVYLNGEKQAETFLAPGTETWCPAAPELFVMLGQDQYFVLGDNREISEDSRSYGAIRRAQILGLIAP